MFVLDPALDAALDGLGTTMQEKGILIAFLLNEVSSQRGRVVGLRAQAANLVQQADELEAQTGLVEGMVGKFIDEVPDPEPEPEPETPPE